MSIQRAQDKLKVVNTKLHEKERKMYQMNLDERLDYLKRATKLTKHDINILSDPASFTFPNADRMIENAIGVYPLPLGIATNFVVNNKTYLVPMATEESSVIAAASKGAKAANNGGGFRAECPESLMIGQVQLVSLPTSLVTARLRLEANKKEILRIANLKSRSVVAKNFKVRELVDSSQNRMGKILLLELLVDTKDAMGANAINTMCESVSSKLEDITGGKAVLKILSNYTTRRLVKCRAIFPKDNIGGKETVENILYAYSLAYTDVYRAVTHNKGIMNGIEAAALATGQDVRAIEAAAHAYAAKTGTYRSLTKWYKNGNGDLVGELELPIAVGIIGGAASVHPIAKIGLKVLGVKTAKELAMVLSAVGLAQNLAALRALVSEGIQRGHMRLHARNIAYTAGCRGNQIELVAKIMTEENNFSVTRAKEILSSLGPKRMDARHRSSTAVHKSKR
jgi:hydroxymethylglutaryl-CoA reductase